jgi:hypothetical protein
MAGIRIQESLNSTDNLEYLNLGFYNFVFLDKELNLIIKLPKTIAVSHTRLYNLEEKQTNKTDVILETQENIVKYLDSLKIIESQKTLLIKKMLKHMELSFVVNTLPSFLHFNGFIVYKNIGVHAPNKIDITPLIVEAFEFLPKLGNVDLSKNLDNILNIIYDFRKYNNHGYYHNDLQENCRNISSYLEEDIRKLKVIDLDDSKKISDLININDIKLDKLQLLFKDYISLVKCLHFHSVINSSDKQALINIDYNALFLKLSTFGKNIEKKYEEIKIFIDNLYKNLIDKVNSVKVLKAGNYYNKYLKYKNKYLSLKNKN